MREDVIHVALQLVIRESVLLAMTLKRPCTADPCAVWYLRGEFCLKICDFRSNISSTFVSKFSEAE